MPAKTKATKAPKKTATKSPTKATASSGAPQAATLKYVMGSARTSLGAGYPNFVVEERDGGLVSTGYGVEWATFRIEGHEVVWNFLCPTDLDDLERWFEHYVPAARAGWLEWREPCARDPRPGLESNFGSFLGTVKRELREAAEVGTWHSIESKGPYIVMPSRGPSHWWGTEEEDAYARLESAEPVRTVEAAGGLAIAIQAKSEVTWVASNEGGTIVQLVSTKGSNLESQRHFFAALPSDGYREIAAEFTVAKSLRCFDASKSSGSIGSAEVLDLKLGAGTYRVGSRTWSPEPGTEVALVRFERLSAPVKRKSVEERMGGFGPKKKAEAPRSWLGSIASNGGPYIVLPEALASAWRGFDDEKTYDAFGTKAPEAGGIVKTGGKEFLALGTPDNLYFIPRPNGGVFVRVVSFDGGDDALAKALATHPKKGWKAAGSWTIATSPLLAFDSALAGKEARSEALSIALEPGTYAIRTTTFEPEGGEFLLTELASAR